ncbi:MAG: heme-binding protein [Clostridia bacterium]|nr:heme-binding protein [Clostridia bacterium]
MTPNEASWLEIIKQQDDALRFEQPITNRDALTIGLYAVEEAKNLGYAFAFRIITNGAIVFSHHMDGVGLGNDWWMDKKLNTARETGISTLRLFAEVQAGSREAPAFLENRSSYAIEGGCVPMRTGDGRIFGYVLASGAPHQYDHEVVTRAIARFLNVKVPSVV